MITHQNSIFIDPENCGSSIGYYITTSEHTPKDKPVRYNVSATVVLTDCSHKIDWSFCGDLDDLGKIESAISMLQEFKKQYIDTAKVVNKLNEKASK